MAQALFITTEDLTKFTAVNGNIDRDNFIQFIKISQDIHIKNYLGSKLYDKINDDIVDGTLANPYLALLTDYIKPMVIHWAMVEYLPWGAYTIANRGIYKHGAETSETVSKNEVDFLIEKERTTAENYTRRFIDYMCYNYNDFPEYTTNVDSDIVPSKNSAFGGWYL
jgi:hypothetical protein